MGIMSKLFKKKPAKVKFYKKRIELTRAVKWTNEVTHEIARHGVSVERLETDKLGSCDKCNKEWSKHGHFKTPHVEQTVCPGMIIFEEINGESYAVFEEEFTNRYENVF